MRFEEMLNDDCEKAEADLPGDLAILAEQLTDDANHLAAQYPAPLGLRAIQTGTHRPTLNRIAAAVVLVAVGAGGAVVAIHPWKAAKMAKVEVVGGQPSADRIANGERPAAAAEVSPDDSRSVEVREVAFTPPAQSGSNLNEVQMLRIQLTAFEQVIHKLQDELARRDKSQAETDKVVEQLRQEVDQLRRQLEAKK